jgi:hypothetical protein
MSSDPDAVSSTSHQPSATPSTGWAALAEAAGKVPWATVFGGLIVFVAAIVGGVVVIVGSSSLNFAGYIDSLSKLAVGVGLVAVGRGVHSAGKELKK